MFEIPLVDALVGDLYQCENRFVQGFNWKRVGTLAPGDVSPYVESTDPVLHNHLDRVPATFFKGLPVSKWKSLQLVRVDAEFVRSYDSYSNPRWQVLFYDGAGYKLSPRLTDPEYEAFLDDRGVPSRQCILTVSLGEPYAPGRSPKYCYKLVAGVIPMDK